MRSLTAVAKDDRQELDKEDVRGSLKIFACLAMNCIRAKKKALYFRFLPLHAVKRMPTN
jgi:hypothetical protein